MCSSVDKALYRSVIPAPFVLMLFCITLWPMNLTTVAESDSSHIVV